MPRQDKPLVISGGKLLDPAAGISAKKDLLVDKGVVKAIDKPGSFAKADGAEQVQAEGCLVTPGLIDVHVHLREPGFEWKETVESGARAAVAGGFTTVCCMPNTNPINDRASVTEFILEAASRADLARVLPIGAISRASEGKALAPLLELRDAGCIAFSDDGSPVADAGLMRKALEYSLMLDAVLTVHEEERSLSAHFAMNESALSLRLGLAGMPGAAEDVMIARDIELARLTGGRVHFCHVSTARAVVLIRRAKEDGIAVTAEVTPHHLALDETAVEGYDTAAKMSMPLRSEEDRAAVLGGLAEGVIDCVASDHAPHEADSKLREFDAASFGMIGLQSTVPLLLSQVKAGKLPLERAVNAMTACPARCLGIEGGTLAVGARADIAILDPEAQWEFSPENIFSKSTNTPFLGETFQGRVVRTFVEGRKVYSANNGLHG